ncbi:MAG: DUF2332 family protein [Rubrivivax sp.]|nr:DUF2332 family protein [Rubrivivax sp.]
MLAAFERQAGWCRQPSPFSARLLERGRAWLAQDREAHDTMAALSADPLSAAVALRWLAGLHHLALRGLQPWAALWPPASGEVDAAALDSAIRLAWQQQRPHMARALSQPPQTNEVQRSAALLPGLLHVAAQTGLPLRLLEIGASAGLNLWPDRYRYALQAKSGPWVWGDPAAALCLRPEWLGPPPPQAALQIAHRAGCDAMPLDLQASGEDLRLASFVWADQSERLLRLQAAIRVARACMDSSQVEVQARGAADFLRQQLAQRTAGQATVLMHSVVWQYIDAAEQADIRLQMDRAGAAATVDTPLAWLRFEPPAADLQVELRCQCWPGGADTLLAHCHPHGNRIDWVAPA